MENGKEEIGMFRFPTKEEIENIMNKIEFDFDSQEWEIWI